ncbi:hypothetical protein [Variovorax sp. UMC13]|uniref:hypothetical protein n=1 Tax=Variovorax sp. UMC13 TaxID=1862326 RepID=UPI0015FF3398|nr:hypothetical protein [Variovorax sp. UMC13]
MAPQKPAAKKKPGRPAIDPGQATQVMAIRLTKGQKDKLDKLGGPPWVRDRIDKAKLPKE